MNNSGNPFLEGVEIARREMTLFFLLDSSGSMTGSKIGALNAALEETFPELKDISENNADAKIQVAIMEFSSGVKWLTPNGPVDINSYQWNTDLQPAGVTDLGAACIELSRKLSKSENGGFMKSASGSFAPVIFLMSDGSPTDNFEAGLQKLKQNNWYKAAIKVAVAIGDDADEAVLAEFTGTSEAVFKVNNRAQLKYMVRQVSVTSSMVASTSAAVSEFGTDSGSAVIDTSVVESTAKQATVINALNDVAADAPDDDSIEW